MCANRGVINYVSRVELKCKRYDCRKSPESTFVRVIQHERYHGWYANPSISTSFACDSSDSNKFITNCGFLNCYVLNVEFTQFSCATFARLKASIECFWQFVSFSAKNIFVDGGCNECGRQRSCPIDLIWRNGKRLVFVRRNLNDLMWLK